jgi:hypothetical protein
MRIINRCVVNYFLIKYYVILMVGIILLIMIEDVMCCLYELCFEIEKLIIWIVVFLDKKLIIEETSICVSLLTHKYYTHKSQMLSTTLFFIINVGVWVSLRAPRLIPRALKLTIM